jgi:hypothetical protein
MGLNIYKKLQKERYICRITFQWDNIYKKLQRSVIFIELRSNEITFVKAPKERHIYRITFQ